MSADSRPKVVCFGDSITAGQYVDPSVRWTSLLSSLLEGIDVLMRGVSGDTTRLALERFERDVEGQRPDAVIIQFGLNDCNCWLTDDGEPRVRIDAYRANLVEMVERCRELGVAHTVLCTSHPTLRYGTMVSGETYESARGRYNVVLREVSRTTQTILCDMERHIERERRRLHDLLLPEPDGLHLSVEGHRLYAVHLGSILAETVRLSAASGASS